MLTGNKMHGWIVHRVVSELIVGHTGDDEATRRLDGGRGASGNWRLRRRAELQVTCETEQNRFGGVGQHLQNRTTPHRIASPSWVRYLVASFSAVQADQGGSGWN